MYKLRILYPASCLSDRRAIKNRVLKHENIGTSVLISASWGIYQKMCLFQLSNDWENFSRYAILCILKYMNVHLWQEVWWGWGLKANGQILQIATIYNVIDETK